jgi:hypothetical protein
MTVKSLVSGLVSGVVSSVVGNGVIGPVFSYDPDAADYFTRAEALGGSFNLSTVNATYTESYTKNAWNTFFAGVRAAGLRTGTSGSTTTGGVIHEGYALHGVTYAGLPAKLWYVSNPVVTLVGFTSGNYVAAGAGGGLNNAVAARIDTNYSQANIAARNSHLCCYVPSWVSGALMGSESAANVNQLMITALSSTVAAYRDSASTSGVSPTIANLTGLHIGTALTNFRYYRNGSLASSASFGATPRMPSAFNTFLFGINRAGAAALQGSQRPIYTSQGAGLTEAQALAYGVLINQLATAFGVNSF